MIRQTFQTKRTYVEAIQWFVTQWHKDHLEADEFGVVYISDEKSILEDDNENKIGVIKPGDYIVWSCGQKKIMSQDKFWAKYELVFPLSIKNKFHDAHSVKWQGTEE